ncbi:hypothetical protein AC1031_013756 [Aphanomyces cochlioides]|nr:hypothetical protein AC1031_013756 [Aphanomyces cochlioides]
MVMAVFKAGAKPKVRSNTSNLPQDYAKSDRLKLILRQHTKKVEFDNMVHTLIAKGDATIDELEGLATNFTSVYDLRSMCSMTNTIMKCSGSLTVTSFKPVLVNVLAKIIDEKMVLDDNVWILHAACGTFRASRCCRLQFLESNAHGSAIVQVNDGGMSASEWAELELCLNTQDYDPALYLACKYNSLETVDLLLGTDVNVNDQPDGKQLDSIKCCGKQRQ